MTQLPPLETRRRPLHLLVPALFLAYLTFIALTSKGYLEADEITHYMFARGVWLHWTSLLSIWGRFGATGIYALLAPFGPQVARLVAVAVTGLTGWGTCVLARECLPPGPRDTFFHRHLPVFAWLLLLAQPCVELYGYAMMTEMPLACCWVWAMVALCRRRVLLAGFVLGIGGLMRPEGWIAIACWPVALLLARYCYQVADRALAVAGAAVPAQPKLRWPTLAFSVFLSGASVLVWYLLGVIAKGNWKWCVDEFPWAAKSQYGPTGGTFLKVVAIALAFWMWVPVLIGSWAAWKYRRQAPMLMLALVLPALGLFLLHGVLGSFGLFGSLLTPRYFLCVAPLLAVLALVGFIEWQRSWRLWMPLVAIVGGCLPVALFTFLGELPKQPVVEQERFDVVLQAIHQRHIDPRIVINGHPYVSMMLGQDIEYPDPLYNLNRLADAPAGTTVVTDEGLWISEGRPTIKSLKEWGYREDPDVARDVDAVSKRYEALTFPPATASQVRLWIRLPQVGVPEEWLRKAVLIRATTERLDAGLLKVTVKLSLRWGEPEPIDCQFAFVGKEGQALHEPLIPEGQPILTSLSMGEWKTLAFTSASDMATDFRLTVRKQQ